jgi:hypothetical protein
MDLRSGLFQRTPVAASEVSLEWLLVLEERAPEVGRCPAADLDKRSGVLGVLRKISFRRDRSDKECTYCVAFRPHRRE